VCGEDISEYAPVPWATAAISSRFSQPVNARTGEPLNWYRLPVCNARFSKFAAARGWLPSPFQRYASLRSIVENAWE
jgi:hypothetical protein